MWCNTFSSRAILFHSSCFPGKNKIFCRFPLPPFLKYLFIIRIFLYNYQELETRKKLLSLYRQDFRDLSISFIIINSNFLSIIRLLVDNQEINQLDHMLVSFVSYLESKNKIYLSNHQLTLKSKWQTIKNIDWFLFLL